MKEINLNKFKIRIPEDSIVGRDEGNIQLLVEHEGGAKELIKVFSSTFETDKGINVKFRNPETNTEYIRWFAGGKRHIELRDFANNPPRENPLIYIKVGAPATREYNNLLLLITILLIIPQNLNYYKNIELEMFKVYRVSNLKSPSQLLQLNEVTLLVMQWLLGKRMVIGFTKRSR